MNNETTKTSSYEQLVQARKEGISNNSELKNIAWLTENSRKFLSSGYLTEGVSPEERIMEIAQNAENILKIDGFAKKFYHYMEEGYYSLASPVWSNFGKREGYQLVVLDLMLLMIWEISFIVSQK